MNPKPPGPVSRFTLHPYERRTYGDHLGVVGILGAFGSVYGEHIVPELLSAARVSGNLMEWDANFYLIGSPKVNTLVREFLEQMQCGRAPAWCLSPPLGEKAKGDYLVQLRGQIGDTSFESPRTAEAIQPKKPHEDFGLVVRGPHPRFPHRMVTILAGPHSLGTGAACLAATNSQVIRKVAEKLGGTEDLCSPGKTIWFVVKGVATPETELHISPQNIAVLHAGVYE